MKIISNIKRCKHKIPSVILIAVTLYLVGTALFFASFSISSDSMYPALSKGDMIWVFKPIYGARIFNIYSAIKGENFSVYRLKGYSNVRRNDIVVFNYPFAEWNRWDRISFTLRKYYVKRCVGIPGDSICVRDGIYNVIGANCMLGNLSMQKKQNEKPDSVYPSPSFISDNQFNWNLCNWGPIYVPKKGVTINIDSTNYMLYKSIIEWEKHKLNLSSDTLILDGKHTEQYTFKHDYYFMAGDNAPHSVDSRYWGMVPDIFIVGKVIFAIENPNLHSLVNHKCNFKIIR